MTGYVCIAGTDTDAGKTVVSAGIARLARRKGASVLVIKAVQTGATRGGTELLAPDLALCASAAPGIATRAIALFEEACSPHLAARRENARLSAGGLAEAIRQAVSDVPAELVILEGAGGLLTPISESETLCDVFSLLGWPMLLVAANRLGAVNHALLSLEVMRARGLSCPGVITNETGEAEGLLERRIRRENSEIIQRLGRIPCLAKLEYVPGLHDADESSRNGAWDRLCSFLEPAFAAIGERRPSGQNSVLLDFDRKHVWHPYTSAVDPLRVWEAAGTQGARIRLADGRELVDGTASWWCAIHGYRHPRLMEALRRQAAGMPHVMFGGLTHEPAVNLAQKILSLAPPGLEHVFFSDSGSVSVEVAIKMALQYQQAVGSRHRTRLLTVRGGYHGDTFGAMSVCDPENGMHSLFSDVLPPQFFAPRPSCRFDAPYDPGCESELERLVLEHAGTIAAIILEPIVQGAGGMWFYHPEYLRRVHGLCKENGLLLILDEVATGFGRTGRMFACEHAGVSPDILCVGKGLTGGVMSLAATLASAEVAEGVSRDGGALMHGPTFMANPLACAVAGASLDLLGEGTWVDDVARVQQGLARGLAPCREEKGVADVRVLGAIGVVELDRPVNTERVQRYFVDQWGVWIRPFGRLLYVMPPYVASDEDITVLSAAILGAVKEEKWK
jgi:adenosylmethionine-8-amino-7-oxononanoate aminotransferase